MNLVDINTGNRSRGKFPGVWNDVVCDGGGGGFLIGIGCSFYISVMETVMWRNVWGMIMYFHNIKPRMRGFWIITDQPK